LSFARLVSLFVYGSATVHRQLAARFLLCDRLCDLRFQRVFLRIARLGTNAVVSWPTNEPSLKLQSSSFLNPHGPSPWSDVPGTPEVSGKEFTIIEPLAAGKFYRLKGY